MHTTPFFDALVHYNVTTPYGPEAKGPSEFHTIPKKLTARAPEAPFPLTGFPDTKDALQKLYSSDRSKIKFYLTSGLADNHTGYPTGRSFGALGETQPSDDMIRVAISFHMLEPLFWNLSTAERLAHQFPIAVLITHELTVRRAPCS